jgi:hypothetical protein
MLGERVTAKIFERGTRCNTGVRRVGTARLWLVEGPVPHFREMVELGREIVRALVEVRGPEETARLFSDPYWLTALSCVLGFEWDTSGQTTVTLRALKEGLKGTEIPVRVLGGKGEEMRWVPYEVERELKHLEIRRPDELVTVSRLSCSIDESALQDSYHIYFHALVVSESGEWSVVNQGMNVTDRTARRYHWSSSVGVSSEGHYSTIYSERTEEVVLDMTSPESREARETILEVLKDTPPSMIRQDLMRAKALLKGQRTLDEAPIPVTGPAEIPEHLKPPSDLDVEVLRRAKGAESFDELLLTKGVGPATIRGLAYVSVLVYGSKASWKDPARFAYAHGTKSGRPYPVNRRAMREVAAVLREAVISSRLGDPEKLQALRRLAALVSGGEEQTNS